MTRTKVTCHHHARAAAWFVFTADTLVGLLWISFGVALVTSLWWAPVEAGASPLTWATRLIASAEGPVFGAFGVKLLRLALSDLSATATTRLSETHQGEHL